MEAHQKELQQCHNESERELLEINRSLNSDEHKYYQLEKLFERETELDEKILECILHDNI